MCGGGRHPDSVCDQAITSDIWGWLPTLDNIYDMHAFSMEDRLFYTLPLLAESLHATPDFPRPTSYAQLCGWLARGF